MPDDVENHVHAFAVGQAPGFLDEFQIGADDDLVGAVLPQEIGLPRRSGDGDHPRPQHAGHLYRMDAHPAGGSGNQHRFAGLDFAYGVQAVVSGAHGARHHRRLFVAHLVGNPHQGMGPHRNIFGIAPRNLFAEYAAGVLTQIVVSFEAGPAMAAVVLHHQGNPVPCLETAGSGAQLRHLAGDFMTDDAGSLGAGEMPLASQHVVVAHTVGADPHQHLPGLGLGRRHLFHGELLQAAIALQYHGFHRIFLQVDYLDSSRSLPSRSKGAQNDSIIYHNP